MDAAEGIEAAERARREGERVDRHARLREEAADAAAFADALEESGFSRKEALELVMHWQGWRWDTEEGAP